MKLLLVTFKITCILILTIKRVIGGEKRFYDEEQWSFLKILRKKIINGEKFILLKKLIIKEPNPI